MKGIIIFAVVCLMVISESYADQLKCYQCDPVISECDVNKAMAIKCGSMQHSRCTKRIKKETTDQTKAIRMCVVPDTNGGVSCPNGYDCFVCDTDLCNTGSMAKFTWISLAGVLFAVLNL